MTLHRTKGLRKQRKTTTGGLKRKALDMFSKYIRLLYSEDGENGSCYTCGVILPIKSLQAGHMVEGRSGSVLFNEALVRPQCYRCNVPLHGNLGVFATNMADEVGLQRVKELQALKFVTLKLTATDYQDIYDTYKRKYEELL